MRVRKHVRKSLEAALVSFNACRDCLAGVRTPNHELTHADLPYSFLFESTFRSGRVRLLPDPCHQVIHRPADQSLSVMPLVPSAATVRTGSIPAPVADCCRGFAGTKKAMKFHGTIHLLLGLSRSTSLTVILRSPSQARRLYPRVFA